MPSQLIQMAGAGTGSLENSVAIIDTPQDGRLLSVAWACHADFDAIGEETTAELSFIATTQFGVNNSLGTVSFVHFGADALTSGGFQSSVNVQYFYDDLRISGGERMHMHVLASAGLTGLYIAMLEFDFAVAQRRSARRR